MSAALAVAAVVTATAGPAGAAADVARPDQGSIGLRLVDAPAAARDDPRARVYIVDHLAPGTTIERRIEVSNTADRTTEIALYAAAATIADGSFSGSVGHTPNDLSSWTSVSPAAPQIPADGRLTATVTIAVPSDGPPGEQYGVVWAEARSDPVEDGGVVQVSRVGIRLYVSVGAGGPPAADFTIDSLTAARSADGRPTVEAMVHNTGGRALDMSGSLQLSAGPGGLSAGPFDATLGSTLAIDATAPVTIALTEQLPPGPWDAEITLKSGLVERRASATIIFPAAGAAPAVTSTSTDSRPGWLYPAVVGLVLLLLAVIAALLLVLGRRQRRPSHDAVVPDEDREPVALP